MLVISVLLASTVFGLNIIASLDGDTNKSFELNTANYYFSNDILDISVAESIALKHIINFIYDNAEREIGYTLDNNLIDEESNISVAIYEDAPIPPPLVSPTPEPFQNNSIDLIQNKEELIEKQNNEIMTLLEGVFRNEIHGSSY